MIIYSLTKIPTNSAMCLREYGMVVATFHPFPTSDSLLDKIRSHAAWQPSTLEPRRDRRAGVCKVSVRACASCFPSGVHDVFSQQQQQLVCRFLSFYPAGYFEPTLWVRSILRKSFSSSSHLSYILSHSNMNHIQDTSVPLPPLFSLRDQHSCPL